jgi:hypothetical protein
MFGNAAPLRMQLQEALAHAVSNRVLYDEIILADPLFSIRWCYQIDRHTQTAYSMDPPDLHKKRESLTTI